MCTRTGCALRLCSKDTNESKTYLKTLFEFPGKISVDTAPGCFIIILIR
jgi:hypothetical protein